MRGRIEHCPRALGVPGAFAVLPVVAFAFVWAVTAGTHALASDATQGSPGQVYTATLSGSIDGHTFEAYQVFAGPVTYGASLAPELSDVAWGDGVDAGRAEEDFGPAADVYAELALAGWGSPETMAFAQRLASGAYLVPDASVRSVYNPDQARCVVSGLVGGCYLFADVVGSGQGREDFAYVPYALRVAGNVDIRCMAEAPILVKKVRDYADGRDEDDWLASVRCMVDEELARAAGLSASQRDQDALPQDLDALPAADVAIQLVVALPANLEAYGTYRLRVLDWLPAGMELAGVAAAGKGTTPIDGVAIEVAGRTYDPADWEDSSISVSLTGKDDAPVDWGIDRGDMPDAIAGASVAVDTASDGRTLEVWFADLLALGASGGDKIIVEYQATAAAATEVDKTYAGLAYLVFPNDPNEGGEGSLGVTSPKAAPVTVHLVSAEERATQDTDARDAASTGSASEARTLGVLAVSFALLVVAVGVGVWMRTRRM